MYCLDTLEYIDMGLAEIGFIPEFKFIIYKSKKLENWVFAPNSDFLITISLKPTVADLVIYLTMNCVRSNNLSLK